MSLLDDVPFGMRKDYGVPTGSVPRPMKGIDHFIYNPPTRRVSPEARALLGLEEVAATEFAVQLNVSAAVEQAVDDYLLMERDAERWRKLVKHGAFLFGGTLITNDNVDALP